MGVYYVFYDNSKLRDLRHEGCSQVPDAARGEAKCRIWNEIVSQDRVPSCAICYVICKIHNNYSNIIM